jgi:large subunit ribosomal protein L13
MTNCKVFLYSKKLTLQENLSIYAQNIMTNFIKKNELENNWLLIDAENLVVGRLAAYISTVLRGKNKNQYTPHMDNGDFVIITNIEKIKFTGKKFNNKKYYRHTGYPGGIKTTNPSLLIKSKPERILKLAVKRMLPGGPLGKKQLSKLKIYKGTVHPHESQNPKIIEFSKMNTKNMISIN